MVAGRIRQSIIEIMRQSVDNLTAAMPSIANVVSEAEISFPFAKRPLFDKPHISVRASIIFRKAIHDCFDVLLSGTQQQIINTVLSSRKKASGNRRSLGRLWRRAPVEPGATPHTPPG